MNVKARKISNAKALTTVAVLIVVMGLMLFAVGCSSSSGGGTAQSTINGHSVQEYNSDVDNLSRILSKARGLDDQIEAMGNPNAFTTQNQVDEYNGLVERYNSAATEYNSAAKAFSSKYGMTIDGAGSSPADPDNIDLPSKK